MLFRSMKVQKLSKKSKTQIQSTDKYQKRSFHSRVPCNNYKLSSKGLLQFENSYSRISSTFTQKNSILPSENIHLTIDKSDINCSGNICRNTRNPLNETKNIFIPKFDIFLPKYEPIHTEDKTEEKICTDIYIKKLKAHMKKLSDSVLLISSFDFKSK